MTDDESRETAHETGLLQITIGKDAYPLKRTLGALRGINLMPGGLQNIINPAASTVVTRVLGRDVETVAGVIRLGCGVGPNAYPKLEQAIFDVGIDEIVPRVSDFIFLLRTKPGTPLPGTKADADQAAEGGDGEAKENPSDRSQSASTSTSSHESPADG